MRLRNLTQRRKTIFLAVTAAAAIGIVAVPASAAASPSRSADAVTTLAAPRAVDTDAAYYANIARGTATLASGKVDTAALKADIADLQNSDEKSAGTVRALTAELRSTTTQVATKVVAYDKEKARKAAEAKAAAKKAAAAEKARKAAEAKKAEQRSTSSGAIAASAPASSAGTSPSSARAYARSVMASNYGWGDDQYQCLNSLWNKESGWSVTAANPSGAYGIPQALPGSKMGAGWQTSASVQINWGLGYIKSVYGTPCAAWGHSQAVNWY